MMNYTLFPPLNFSEMGQRDNQEDALRPLVGKATSRDRLFVLCDGMGGADKGEVASNVVADAFVKEMAGMDFASQPLTEECFNQVLERVYDDLDKHDDGKRLRKMGTTLTLLCFHAGGVLAAHIGDSRIYQVRPSERRVVFVTRDHSKVNDMIALGEISPEQAKTVPYRNIITRAMQPCAYRDPADVAQLTDVRSGDYFVMCSDGVLEQIDDDGIVDWLAADGTDEQKLERMRRLTVNNKDNHTLHLIHVQDVQGLPMTQPAVPEQSMQADESMPVVTVDDSQPKSHRGVIIALALALLAALAVIAWMTMREPQSENSPKPEAPIQDQQITHPSGNIQSVSPGQSDKPEPIRVTPAKPAPKESAKPRSENQDMNEDAVIKKQSTR